MNENPELLLATGFARHVSAWAAAQGAAAHSLPALAHAAQSLSLAVSDGHVCVALAELGTQAGASEVAAIRRLDAAAWRATLLASGVVGTPDAPGALPLILGADDRLYLHRYFDYERRLARRLT
ncbi:MAG: exodeoxyribonuclease V subunit alpha, partial [Betaproteobacteria bacterium]